MFKCIPVYGPVYSGQCSNSYMPLELTETNPSTKHNGLKNANWWEADQLAIYNHDRGVKLGSTKKRLQLSGQSGT